MKLFKTSIKSICFSSLTTKFVKSAELRQFKQKNKAALKGQLLEDR